MSLINDYAWKRPVHESYVSSTCLEVAIHLGTDSDNRPYCKIPNRSRSIWVLTVTRLGHNPSAPTRVTTRVGTVHCTTPKMGRKFASHRGDRLYVIRPILEGLEAVRRYPQEYVILCLLLSAVQLTDPFVCLCIKNIAVGGHQFHTPWSSCIRKVTRIGPCPRISPADEAEVSSTPSSPRTSY